MTEEKIAAMKEPDLYRNFSESQQAAIKLALALEGYFRPESELEHWKAYEAYLQKRIRPAVEIILDADNTERLSSLEKSGWFTKELVDQFLQLARQKGKIQCLIWLLRYKQEKYGYERPEYSL